MKFPPLRIQTEFCVCVSVCAALWVGFIHCPSCRGRKQHRETQRSEGTRGKIRAHMLPPCCHRSRPETSVFSRSHPFVLPSSFFLSLAVSSPRLHFSFFHPSFFPPMSESNELYAPYLHTIPLLTFLFITRWHLRFATSPILAKLPFLAATEEGAVGE